MRNEGPAFYTVENRLKIFFPIIFSCQLFILFFFFGENYSFRNSVGFEWSLFRDRTPRSKTARTQVSDLEIVIENRSLKLQLMDDEARIESTILGPYQTKRYSSKRIHITSS